VTSCSEMKKGQIYACPDCGVELQVIKECSDTDHCGLEQCKLVCCDKEMELKSE
jgi:hypothetical protein